MLPWGSHRVAPAWRSEEEALVDASRGGKSRILVLGRNLVVALVVVSVFLFNPYHQLSFVI